jgi:hypothetical protein
MEMNEFAKNIFSQGQTLFTQNEFDKALAEVREEILGYAMHATHMAILIEREACAKMADECLNIEELGDAIRNRIPEQRQ